VKDLNHQDLIKIKKIIDKSIKKIAILDDKKTNPGFVMVSKKFNNNFYKNAVQNIVSLKQTKIFLDNNEAFYKGYKNCRGLIGATAAISWSASYDKTYEIISYRLPKNWGTERNIDINSIIEMDKSIGSTFDNFDYENNHNRISPNSPCPILYGIRGNCVKDLIKATTVIESETPESWLVFETNQGTDDHLVNQIIPNIKRYQSVIVKGEVSKNPYTLKGGHVFFTIYGNGKNIDCAAYEPTKQFRNIIRKLRGGDKVKVYGGIRNKPLTINIEKIQVISLSNITKKIENPICPKCGKHMKSVGKNQGFRCKNCKTKDNNPKMTEMKRELKTGTYEVPVCARRHLSKPLKRINQK
jgi:tRNA(Ile2)-agmatinylcytidine synthase